MEDSPVYAMGQLQVWVEEQLIARRQQGGASGLRSGMKGARVDGAIVSVSSKEFGEGVVQVVPNEWGNDIFISKWNDEEVASPVGIEVILPARSRMGAWLGVSRSWHLVFLALHQLLDLSILVRDLAVENHG